MIPCKHFVSSYCKYWDAKYCKNCLVWLENKCSSKNCPECSTRPSIPFEPDTNLIIHFENLTKNISDKTLKKQLFIYFMEGYGQHCLKNLVLDYLMCFVLKIGKNYLIYL